MSGIRTETDICSQPIYHLYVLLPNRRWPSGGGTVMFGTEIEPTIGYQNRLITESKTYKKKCRKSKSNTVKFVIEN